MKHSRPKRVSHLAATKNLVRILCFVLTACLCLALSACGGSGGSSSSPPGSGVVSGNWQFTMAEPPDNSFVGGLQGGFLQQQGTAVTGQTVYSVSLPGKLACNSGSASMTGTVNGQSVNLTAVAGSQTFTFSGTISSDSSTITGTYSSTVGTAPDGSACGTVQNGLQFTATSVPPLTGGFQGFFHSTVGNNGFQNQDFPLTGSLAQGPNIGATSATVTGTVTFKDPSTNLTDYPCTGSATITGQISGNTVILQLFTSNGLDIGQIGGIKPSAPVTYDNTQAGYVVHNMGGNGTGYAVINTKGCPGSAQLPGDQGNLCLAFGNSTACTQPITLTPVSFNFVPQLLGSVPTLQTFTLTNSQPSGQPLSGISVLKPVGNDSGLFYQSGGADFNGLPNFTVVETGAASDCTTLAPLGSPFDLPAPPNNSCTITISFSPQQSCPWLPFGSLPSGLAPAKCPIPFNQYIPAGSPLVSARLTVNSPSSVDNNSTFLLPVSGTGLSALVPSTPELDFGAEDVGESSQPQTLTFTNQSANPVQILPLGNTPCVYSTVPGVLPRPPKADGTLAGLQIVSTGGPNSASISPNPAPPPFSPAYFCDADPAPPAGSGLPNFQISSDTCSGQTLGAQGSANQSCSLEITFAPQPATWKTVPLNPPSGLGLDYFLELNTLWCDPNNNPVPGPANPCELDSGRFPLELKTNPPGSLRMTPAAGLNFGTLLKGTLGTSTITLSNDQADATTVTLTGKVTQGADYLETDTCGGGLSPGASCTLTFTFTPSVSGADTGTFTLSYNSSGSSGNQFGLRAVIFLRGIGQ